MYSSGNELFYILKDILLKSVLTSMFMLVRTFLL